MEVAFEQKNAKSEMILEDSSEKRKKEEAFDLEEYLFFLDIFNSVINAKGPPNVT